MRLLSFKYSVMIFSVLFMVSPCVFVVVAGRAIVVY